MNKTIERLKRNRPLMALGVIVNIICFTVFMVGLAGIVHGQEVNTTNSSRPVMAFDKWRELGDHIKVLESLINYCYQHADRPNPIQDLADKGLIDAKFNGKSCSQIRLDLQEANILFANSDIDYTNSSLTKALDKKAEMMKDRFDKLKERQEKAITEEKTK